MGDRVGIGNAGHTGDWTDVRRKFPKAECRVFIGNLPFLASMEGIRARFGQFGALTNVFIPAFPASGRSKGFAFTNFKRREDVKTAIELLNGRFLGHRRMTVSAAINRPANRPTAAVRGSRIVPEATQGGQVIATPNAYGTALPPHCSDAAFQLPHLSPDPVSYCCSQQQVELQNLPNQASSFCHLLSQTSLACHQNVATHAITPCHQPSQPSPVNPSQLADPMPSSFE
ncbi:uncharacterized protein LOC131235666 [Magnolia sinica]|uniref:uncharacterized protein LOC131235666 n=1 Tax=Magnolia sinica TaxID=86752 RepID=UPI00265B6290|nr:uncharacterized protein LOC131235666 [Magnolia sinica]